MSAKWRCEVRDTLEFGTLPDWLKKTSEDVYNRNTKQETGFIPPDARVGISQESGIKRTR